MMAIYVYAGQVSRGVTVFNDSMYVYQGGVASYTKLYNSGSLYVSYGGVTNLTIVNSGGIIHVSQGAVADSTIVSSGGSMYVSGGEVTRTTVDNGGRMYIYRDGTANSTTVNSAGRVYVYSGGVANSNTVNDDCVIYVSSCGVANSNTVEGWGSMYIFKGGTANLTTVNGWGSMFVNSGVANLTTLNGGTLNIYAGGTANYTTMAYGYYAVGRLFVSSGGTANYTTMNQESYAYVYSGGVMRSATVNLGGELCLSSGGRLTGEVTVNYGGTVSAYSGSFIDFDVSTVAPGSAARFNDISAIKGSPSYTITVASHQQSGTYTLAGGASGLGKSLTVNTVVGMKIGTISIGGKLKHGAYTYTLARNDSTLMLTVEGGTPKRPADDLNGDGRGDIVMTITRTTHPDCGATGAWLIQENQTAAWSDLSRRDADWTLFGMGCTAAGKTTNDIYLRSTGNVIGAWTTDTSGRVTGWTTVGEFDANTQVLGLGDFNGDGQTDLLLRNTNGAVGGYFTSGEQTGWRYFQSLGNEWTVAAIGDLNGDGIDDVVLTHSSGATGSWIMRGDGKMSWVGLDTLKSGFSVAGTGDFNGDGIDDVLLKKGNYYGAWIVEGGKAKSWMGLGTLGNVTVEEIADFDADGVDDLRVRTAAGDLGAQLVRGEDKLQWRYYGSVGKEWSTSLAAI